MVGIRFKDPDSPATERQKYTIHKLTGEDMGSINLTKQQASDKIAEVDVKRASPPPMLNGTQPFHQANVTLIEGEQGCGKSNTAVGMVVDDYFNDCVRIYLEKQGIDAEVKGYDRKNRIARIKKDGKIKLIRIPQKYELKSPMKIFANFHLCGIPFVFIPSFPHLLKWLKMGLIGDCWLLLDEYYVGGNARDSMSAFGKEMEKQSYQMRKLAAKVVIITPHARLIDKWTRLTPTKHIICSYDEKKREITLTVKKKGERGSKILPPYDATQYWPNYFTNERING